MRTMAAVAFGVALAQASGSAFCPAAAAPESDPRFKAFLQESAQTLAFLAHPTDTFRRASVDDSGLVSIETTSSWDGAPLVLHVRVRLDEAADIERVWVVRDTAAFPPAFAGVEVVRGFVTSSLERDEQDAALSADGRERIRRLRRALATMDGRQITQEFLRLKWRFTRFAG